MKTFLLILFLLVFTVQDDFTFVNGNQKIVLKIDDGSRNLVWGKKSILNLKVENIDPKKMNMSAPGIMFVESKNPNEEVSLEITPKKSSFEKDTLNLHVGYKTENDDYVHHRFSIAIKK